MVTEAGPIDLASDTHRALVDAVIPADDLPGGWVGGVERLGLGRARATG
jgi:hypothetical protein